MIIPYVELTLNINTAYKLHSKTAALVAYTEAE
jgi:hypothetical protein